MQEAISAPKVMWATGNGPWRLRYVRRKSVFESQGVVHLSTGGVQAEKERGKVGKKKEKEGERKRGDGNKREGERVREGKKEAKKEEKRGRGRGRRREKKKRERNKLYAAGRTRISLGLELDVNMGKASGREAGSLSALFKGGIAIRIPPSHGSRKATVF